MARHFELVLTLFFALRVSRGGDRGSGSSWAYDGGVIVQKSVELGKPVILVTIK